MHACKINTSGCGTGSLLVHYSIPLFHVPFARGVPRPPPAYVFDEPEFED